MTLLKIRYFMALAAGLWLAGCGEQEKTEGIQLAKILKAQQADFMKTNATERDFIANARAWCGGITSNGAGRGKELDQNAAVSAALAKTAVDISTNLSGLRQAITAPALTEEYPVSIRDGLINDLTKRQRALQEMRAALQDASPQFLQYAHQNGYKGDTYPDGITKMNTLLQSYSSPTDIVGTALDALKDKYKLTDAQL
jgi:hypothetical protein